MEAVGKNAGEAGGAAMRDIKSKDGTNIVCATHNFENESIRGIVIVCHGFGEHSGRYEGFASELARFDYGCAVFNQRGHGNLHESKLGAIPGYESYLEDVEAVVAKTKETMPSVPLALFGHSMGGNIAANYLLRRNQSDFSCAVLESPWFGLHPSKESPFVNKLAKQLSGVWPNMPLPKSKTKLSLGTITDDAEMQKEIGSDPLYHNRMTFRMFSCVNNDGCSYALANAAMLSVPTFLAYAEDELIVSNDAIAAFHKLCKPSLMDYKGYKTCHSIHSGLKRKDFYSDLLSFLNKRCHSVESVDSQSHAK
jgi:alpha-beta hydrolase superfamily lysophospholipase